MRILVTGATGNVGTAVLRRLTGRGDEVVGLARRVPTRGTGEVEWRSVDLTAADDGALLAAMRGADAVVHLAWGFQPSHRLDRLRELGVGGTRRVVDAALSRRVPHLVHLSSAGVYSPRSTLTPVDEDYPREGVPTSPYSQHKAAAEHLLDEVPGDARLVVTRLRPGIIGQLQAGSALVRYAVPGLVPGRAIAHLPVLPLDRRLLVPMVHADDVADAVVRALDARVPGPFNLAATTPVGVDDIAAVLDARVVHVPAGVLRAALSLVWHARVEQLDPGWLDLAYAVPMLDCGRAERDLGWQATRTGVEVLREMVAGMVGSVGGDTPVLRPRSLRDNLASLARGGPVHRRPAP